MAALTDRWRRLRRFLYQFQPVWWGWRDRQPLVVYDYPTPDMLCPRIFTGLSLGVFEIRYWHGQRPVLTPAGYLKKDG